MKVLQTRNIFTLKQTVSSCKLLDDDGKILLEFYVLEDKLRGMGDPKTVLSWKVKGESCIPYGKYMVEWAKSPSRGYETLRLLNVPGFSGILVHSGNTEKDTEGCLLPGFTLNRGKDSVSIARSKDAVKAIQDIVVPRIKGGEVFYWEIVS